MNLHEQLSSWILERTGLTSSNLWIDLSVDGILLLGVMLMVWLIFLLCHSYVARTVTRWAKKSSNTWDDEFIHSGIIRRVSRLIPTLLLWSWAPAALRQARLSSLAQTGLTILLIWVVISVLFSVLNTVLGLYSRRKISREVPLQGISQTIKILLSIGAFILTLSVILGKSPALIFSGFGALTAILMLVFKDAILGLAAGIQLASNRMIAVGDWIEVPKYGANGSVLELALTTVKVQNWDKTITTVPTYALISDSFKNWRGMSDSGLRRIKRSLTINIDSVRFLSEEEVQQHGSSPFLRDYIAERLVQLKENEHSLFPPGERRLTNIGTFRAYILAYLQAHPLVSQDVTTMVRQLQPTEYGIPIELYLFSNDNRWIEYENFQSDLFDHLIATLPQFGLSAYQAPAGNDLRALTTTQEG